MYYFDSAARIDWATYLHSNSLLFLISTGTHKTYDCTDSPLISQLKRNLQKKIKVRWEHKCADVSTTLLLSSALNPHFKQLTFTESKDSEKEESKEKIVDYMEKLKEESCNGNKFNQVSTEAGEPPAKKRKHLMCYWVLSERVLCTKLGNTFTKET